MCGRRIIECMKWTGDNQEPEWQSKWHLRKEVAIKMVIKNRNGDKDANQE